MRKFLLLFFFSCCLTWIVGAKGYRFESLSIEDGLSQATVYSILQDDIGFLWFGTEAGLNRYDGYEFKVYVYDDENPMSISNYYINALLSDKNGDIWVGTDNGINKYLPAKDGFEKFYLDEVVTSKIYTIIEDKQGDVIFGTNAGIWVFDDQKKDVIPAYDDINCTLIRNKAITSLLLDESRLWIGTEKDGLFCLDYDRKQIIQIPVFADNSTIYSLLLMKDKLFVGTGNGMYILNIDMDTYRAEQYAEEVSNTRVLTLFQKDHDEIWAGTDNGLWMIKEDNIKNYSYKLGAKGVLSANRIHSIYQDNGGIIWLGTYGGGAAKYDEGRNKFGVYIPNHAEKGVSHGYIREMYEDNDGNLWICSDGGGVNIVNRKTNSFKLLNYNELDKSGLNSNRVFSIMHRGDEVWLGTYGGGINIYNLKNKTFRIVNSQSEIPIVNDNIRELYEARDGSIWVGTEGGITRLFFVNGELSSKIDYVSDGKPGSLSFDKIIDIIQDEKGIYWIATMGGGLNRFEEKTKSFTSYQFEPGKENTIASNFLVVLLSDGDKLWIGTHGGGLSCLNKATGEISNFSMEDGLSDNSVYGVLKDSRGFLWLSSNKGLTRYNPENGNVKIYDINDGLQSYEFNGKSCYKSKRGEMFFGGIRGLNYFFPDSIKDNQYKPPVVITDFSISNQSVPVNEKFNGRVILSKPIYNSEEIELTHEDNVVTFEFSSLDFADPSKNQYEYKMEGFDKDWNEIGNRRYTSYTNLPHGEYVFMVRGSNCDGVWNTEGTSLRVVVLPPWWRTHFFYISVTLAFILIVLGYIRFRVHRLKRDKEILEVEVARRTDEIEERKEELSAQAQHLEMVNKRLEELSVVARETANAITIFDNTGKIEYRNNAFMKLYGEYLKEPVLKEGHSLSELDKKYKIHSYFDDCLREKKPITFTSRRKLEDKSDHWIQTTLTPVFDELGKVEKLVSIDTDITEIKSAEKKILEQAEELEMLSLVASKTDNAVIIADQCGEIEWVNEGFVNITGYTFEQYKKERETNFYNAITVPEVRETLKENIDNKKSTSYYSQLTTRTGNTIWLQSTINPLFDKDGELIKLIAIESNINKLKKAEEEIKRKNRQITDSINYAQKIQNSILPSDQEFKRVFSDYFILFKPRDIVSGDFYWLTELGDKIIVACGDSTGHGVPGGFMSMMGNALLNEIVLEKGIYSASDVLKQLNLSIRSALKQSLEGEQEDGMDISICCIDKGTKMLDVAAANQTIYYRTKEGFLQEYEGDIFSVGGMLLSKPEVKFGSKQLPLSDISAVYMCSDGYQDQFGGEHNQKFMSARLKELISSVMDKTMTEQYASIEATFEIWKKDQKQIDDILVMGLKF